MKTNLRPGQPPLVSIIIPVYNKCDLTVQCLQALAKATSQVPHEIIVVDNASSDATPQRMQQQQAAHIRYVRNEVNRNFAGACNQGAAAATGKYWLFLNNDTIPVQGWLEALLDELRTHPEVAAVGSKLLYESGHVQHAGVVFARDTRSPFHPYRMLRMDDARVNRRRELQAVTAACVLIRPKWFQDCGGFSEDFRNGYEDLDLCLKIRQRGGVIVYQPKSVVFHLESQTPGRMKFDNENRALFFQRWQSALLADEDAFYHGDGYYKTGVIEQRPEAPRLVRFADDAERAQWLCVAQCQTFATQWRRDEVVRILGETTAWPQEPQVRRWAGCLSQRLGQSEIAQKHFAAALALEQNPEVRLLVPEMARTLAEFSPQPWTASLEAGFNALQAGQAGATEALEQALFDGAPPALVLGGWWQAAPAAPVRQALSQLARLDPATTRRLTAPQASPVVSPSVPENRLVSIIILVLNQLEHTKACLQSIVAHTPTLHEVIIVDNGSTDGTPEFLKNWQVGHANCTVIRNETNRGFAGGNNQGLAVARGEFLLWLNNDTVVTPGWLEAMLAVYARHPETGLVGPMSNRVSGPQFVREAVYSNLDGMQVYAAQFTQANAGQSFEVVRAVGFCLLSTKAVVAKVGALDETFGSGNFEDDDYCLRTQLAGFRIRVARDSFVHHTGSQTFAGEKIDYRSSMLRNWEIFRTKWELPAEASLEKGYPIPKRLPEKLSLLLPLPKLASTHVQEGSRWTEKPKRVITPVTLKPAPVAGLGRLDEARELFAQKDFAAAWTATLAALTRRPFHPEAYLLLAEIALAAGDGQSAKACAQRAKDYAPTWAPVRQFLTKSFKGNTRPEWLDVTSFAAKPARLSVCLIVKNEERFLAQCLKSVRGFAQQLVVVDTGSTDRTVEIAREFGAEIHSFAWTDDFAAARNAALEHATGDWILMLDADEELLATQHAKLRNDMKVAEVIASRLPLVNVGMEAEGHSYVPRLFRNAPGVCFHGRIHEQIFASLLAQAKKWELKTALGTAELRHHGYTQEMVVERNKVERNLKLLQQAIEENPADVNLMMNWGLELVKSGKLTDGLEKYRAAFEMMSQQPAGEVVPELREVLLTQFTSQLYKIREHGEVVSVLTSPLAKQTGLTASLHFSLGLSQFELKNYREAAEQMRQCWSKRKQPALTPINLDTLTAAPHHCLALSLAKLGDNIGAEKAFQAALLETGRVEESRLDYARFLWQSDRPVEALEKLTELVGHNNQVLAAWKLGGEIALAKPEFLEFACDWTSEAVRAMPENPALAIQRGEALLLAGRIVDAAPVWERLWRSEPQPRSQAALILCELLADKPLPAPSSSEAENATSLALIEWYQKFIAARAGTVMSEINQRLAALSRTLPTAAQMLEAALSEVVANNPAPGGQP